MSVRNAHPFRLARARLPALARSPLSRPPPPPPFPQATSITPSTLALPPGALVECLPDPADERGAAEEQSVLVVRRPDDGAGSIGGGAPHAPGPPPGAAHPPPPVQEWELVVSGAVSAGRPLKW